MARPVRAPIFRLAQNYRLPQVGRPADKIICKVEPGEFDIVQFVIIHASENQGFTFVVQSEQAYLVNGEFPRQETQQVIKTPVYVHRGIRNSDNFI